MNDGSPPLRLDAATRNWLAVGVIGLVLTVAAGVWVGVLLSFAYTLPAGDAFQFGRLRPLHTRLAVHLWLAPCTLGVLRARMGIVREHGAQALLPWVWALLQLAGCAWVVVVGVQGPAYAEVPAWIDVGGALVLAVAAIPLVGALRRGGTGHEGTGLLYAAETIVWAVLLTVFVHAVLPFFDGTRYAALHRMWMADGIGLVITPAAAAIAYLSLPAVTGGTSRRPWLGRLGFFALALTYVLAGGRHALFGTQPETLASIGWITSLAIGVPSAALAWNVIESVARGRSPDAATREAAAWLLCGAALWMLLAAQGVAQSIPAVNAVVSKTDWVAGHAHLGLFGAVGALVMGGVQGVLAGSGDAPRRTSKILRRVWVLAALGMAWVLAERALRDFQADLGGVPYATRFGQIQGAWHTRLTFGLLLAIALFAWAFVALRCLRRGCAAGVTTSSTAPIRVPLGRRAAWATGLGVLAFVVILVLIPANDQAPLAEPARGELVYRREGCVHCHTRAPRSLDTDRALFGEPIPVATGPAEPGTRRIGPDLAHVGMRRSRDWLRAHLENPAGRKDEAGHEPVHKTAMPSFSHLEPRDLDELADWLSSLR